MPRKAKNKQYFTKDTEDAIIEYNLSDNQRIKDLLYRDRIKPAFDKLAEIVYNKWKFSYFDDEPQDVMCEVVAFMIEKIHMYKNGKGKAFSYFTIVARNYLILNNNANKNIFMAIVSSTRSIYFFFSFCALKLSSLIYYIHVFILNIFCKRTMKKFNF